ncbi:GNAT family N-acetyltransferase [Nonomuraea sp. SYSU D8015]|uniref:GNAT family N-acetyltransferase n=1 Tax=Nonomuraea sp. SYSU D8015 TaxID=2593644 RepID=UPI001CB6BCB0|nr:GNAT family N-acetyltransferase [Nonomuraea sp. SYSU D8015]
MQIRTARPDDLPALLDLAAAFYREGGFSTPESELRANLDTLVAWPTARVAVCEGDGRLVAFAITTTTFGLESGLYAELEDLYVAPEARRRGLAARLIEDSRRWAAEKGCADLEVVIAPNGGDVSHLFDFYARLGFVDEGRRLLTHPLTPSA